MTRPVSRSRVFAAACLAFLALAATGDDAAMKLSKDIVHASGGDQWGKVSRIQFTWTIVNADGKPAIVAKHDWDVRKGTDTVNWGDKNVTVDLNGKHDEGDAKEAFK